MDPEIRALLDEHACRKLLETYCYAVDWKNWGGLAGIFWPDATFDFGMWSGDTAGFIPWVEQLEDGYTRRLHMFAMPLMAIGTDSGRAEVGNTTVVRSIDENGDGQEDIIFGRYQFRFERRDGKWLISALHFFMHGTARVAAADAGGAPVFADNLDTKHPRFAQ